MRLLCAALHAGLLALLSLAAAQSDADDAARAVEEARAAAANASNAFSLDLFRELSTRRGNLVVCPLSAAVVLALTWLGAAGDTAQQLRTALHLPNDPQQVARGFHAMLALLTSDLGPVTLKLANKMYVRNGAELKETFTDLATQNFEAETEQLNFANDTENARLAINSWVANATEGKIQELFEEGSPRREALVVLVNAIYFKAGWKKKFEESHTAPGPFQLLDGSSIQVPVMHGYFQLSYAEIPELNARTVLLPYHGKRGLRMFILLPNANDGINELQEKIQDLNLDEIDLNLSDVTLSIPKFEMEDKLSLGETLKQMNVTDLFSPGANLQGIADEELFVSKVVQKTFISVNEKGTEASAATGVDIRLRSSFPRVNFVVDRPFVFLVVSGDVILFMGRVHDPRG